MEVVVTYKRPRKSLPTPQKVVSFKAFEAKEKCKIQTAYPFLSPEQIKGKIKDRWNRMTDSQKQNYTTYKIGTTPQRKANKKGSTGVKRRMSLDLFSPVLSKQVKLDRSSPSECSDISAGEKAGIYADFMEDFDRKTDDPKSAVFPRTRKNTNNFYGNKPPDWKDADIQRVLANSPDSDADDVGYLEDSDDDEGLLIHRDDMEYEPDQITTGNTENSEKPPDNSSSENKSLKCEENSTTKTERLNHDKENIESGDHNKKDSTNTCTEPDNVEDTSRDSVDELNTIDTVPENTTVNSKRNKPSLSLRKSRKENETPQNEVFKPPLINESITKKARGSRSRKERSSAVLEHKTPDMSKVTDKATDQLITPLTTQLAETDYTTPLMDESLQHLTVEEAVKAPQKPRPTRQSAQYRVQPQPVRRHILTQPASSSMSTKANTRASGDKQTRHGFTNNTNTGENCVTSGDKKTVNDASQHSNQDEKIPNGRDRKCNNDSNVLTKTRSTRSRKSLRSNKTEHDSPSTGKADKTISSDESTQMDCNNNSDNDTSVINMDPSGDAGKNIGQKTHVKNDEVKNKDQGPNRGDFQSPSKENAARNMKCLRRSTRGHSFSPRSTSSVSSNSQHSSSEVSSPELIKEHTKSASKKKKSTNTNPVLERALKLLQLPASSSPDHDSPDIELNIDNTEMDTHSPGILSPALSGISELSSVSSSMSSSQESTRSIQPFNCLVSAHQPVGDECLTKLFTDLTPPEQKTQGLYKTQRLLKGSHNRAGVTMTEFFTGDSDIF